MPASVVPVCAPPSTLTNFKDFLRSQGRRTYNVLPNGNCMFRALSHQLFGTDEFHGQLRQMLLAVIQSNHTIYEPYWIEHTPSGIVEFDEHVKSLAKAGSWGTHVELQATSDCFNIPVYVSSSNLCHIIRWEKKAVPRHHSTINLPALNIMPTFPFTSNHLELFYSSSHYQSVVPRLKDTKLMPPTIICRNSDSVICINDL